MEASSNTGASSKARLHHAAIWAKRSVRERGMATLRLVLLVPSLAVIAAVGLSMLVVLPPGGQTAGIMAASASR